MRIIRNLLVVLALLGCAAQGATRNDAALWRPRFATPTIVALDFPTNREFTAEIAASQNAKDWSITISNDLRAWACPVISARYAKIDRETKPGWVVKASVPPDTSPELCGLVVSCSEF